MNLSITELCVLLETKGPRAYQDEQVSQLEHALQTATLAENARAPAALIAAALLHDIGHLVNDHGETPTARGINDLHEVHGAHVLDGLFPALVLEPIRLHVEAKRYLCRARPGYFEALSPDSRRSLALQGGAFSANEAEAFLKRPYAREAVDLRLWDDGAKLAGAKTPSLAHFAVNLRVCALPKH